MTRTWTCPVCELGGDACACGVDKRPGVCGGRWVVRGTRVWVSSLAGLRGADRVERAKFAVSMWPHLGVERVEQVERWLDAGGMRALAEDTIAELCADLTQSEELHGLADACRHAGSDAEALFEGAVGMVRRAVWRAGTGAKP